MIWVDKETPLIVPVTTLAKELGKKMTRKHSGDIFVNEKEAADSFAKFVQDWVKAPEPDQASQVSKEYVGSDGIVAKINLTWASTAEGSGASQSGSTQEASSS